jgi:hypothetical protein
VQSVLRPTGAETTADLLDDVSIIKKGTARS